MADRGNELLQTYRQKRDFAVTKEPSGNAHQKEGRKDLYFCVQKHDATRLHYDFRLEWEGVLKSWAVTRGPSLDPADKRLAVRTEDHPYDYGDFEGTIPTGHYGGGTVMLWDRGAWEPLEDPDAGFAKGSLKFRLEGERMHGKWALVRMKPRSKEKRENWLLIKEKDEVADTQNDLLSADTSVKTGRSMDEIAKGPDVLGSPRRSKEDKRPGDRTSVARKSTKASKSSSEHSLPGPRFRDPQLATLVDKAPEGDSWISEVKYDGYRVVISIGSGGVKLYTRSGKDWTDRFTGVADAARDLKCRNALIDGEVVAFDEKGRTDFSTLQDALTNGEPLSCFCFDLMELDGNDLTKKPLLERKAALKQLIEQSAIPNLLYSEHVSGNGPEVFKHICAAGHEGIISKVADSPYRGGRGRSWLKIKCSRRQEFVIGGWSASDKRSRPFSSVLLGVFDGDRLVYRGRVGSGFTGKSLDDLRTEFERLSRKTSPFSTLPHDVVRGAHFVAPELVAEIEFAELTGDGAIRHGVFKGIRTDKAAGKVVDEVPAATASQSKKRNEQSSSERNTASDGSTATSSGRGRAEPKPYHPGAGRSEIAGIRLTHPDRIIFEDQGLTKADLAAYYEAVAERMLHYSADRPVSLVRCPAGAKRHCFFQKHDSGGFPASVRSVDVEEKDGSTAAYLTLASAAALVGAVQMNTLEFHIWGGRNDRLDRPDRIVLDLDPDESLGFEEVKLAAFDLRARLLDLDLQTFPMVTGGKGVHVVAPLARRQGWEDLKTFARAFALQQARSEPKRFIATMSKEKRKGRIFIDWLRNERGATAIAPYSTRSRSGAPVATPVTWDELEGLSSANGFMIGDVVDRLEQVDPWKDYGNVRQSITKALIQAVT